MKAEEVGIDASKLTPEEVAKIEKDLDKNPGEVKKTEPRAVIAFEKGFAAKTFDDVWRLASLYFKASVAPRKAGFDSIEKVAAAVEYCSKQGLIFQAAVNNMAWIEDRLCLWGDLPTSICRGSGKLESLVTKLIDAEYTEICSKNKNLDKEVFASVTTIKVKDREPQEYFFTVKDAERAGLMSKGVWKSWKQIMMRRKSTGYALKFEMSDILQGIGIAEYDFNTSPELGIRDVTSPQNPSTTTFLESNFGESDVHQTGSGGVAGDAPGQPSTKEAETIP